MPPIPDTSAIVLAVLVSVAAILDARTRRLPNWLTVSGFLLGLVIAAWNGRFGAAVAGAVLALAVYVPLFALRAMGGGDVKLMAAVGALAGFRAWLPIFLLTAMIGGCLAVALVLKSSATGRTLRNLGLILGELGHGRPPSQRHPELSISSPQSLTLPHGVSIALGVLSYLVLSGRAH